MEAARRGEVRGPPGHEEQEVLTLMSLVNITPSALAVLREAATSYAVTALFADDPQPTDPHVAIGRAAEYLGAPAHAELAASRALDEALGSDSEYWAFTAALDAEMRRRMDVDLWLQDWRARR